MHAPIYVADDPKIDESEGNNSVELQQKQNDSALECV